MSVCQPITAPRVPVVRGAQTLRAGSCEEGSSDWERAKRGRRLEGNNSVSGFFHINLCAALENCHRHSEDLVKEQDTSAVPLYTLLRDAGCLLPFIPLEPQTKQFFLTNSGRWRLSGLLLAVKWSAVKRQCLEPEWLRWVPGMFCWCFKRA